MPGGNLSPIFGLLIGTGPGTGMAIMFSITGILGAFVGFGAYMIHAIRDVEDILPDHDAK